MFSMNICLAMYALTSFLPRYVDAVFTIPKGTLYPMCGMNLAFNRELIGPAMYFGLFGEGQPIQRYDDMWAGWCSKVLSFLVVILIILSLFSCSLFTMVLFENLVSLG